MERHRIDMWKCQPKSRDEHEWQRCLKCQFLKEKSKSFIIPKKNVNMTKGMGKIWTQFTKISMSIAKRTWTYKWQSTLQYNLNWNSYLIELNSNTLNEIWIPLNSNSTIGFNFSSKNAKWWRRYWNMFVNMVLKVIENMSVNMVLKNKIFKKTHIWKTPFHVLHLGMG
jgi:hypothetical protein